MVESQSTDPQTLLPSTPTTLPSSSYLILIIMSILLGLFFSQYLEVERVPSATTNKDKSTIKKSFARFIVQCSLAMCLGKLASNTFYSEIYIIFIALFNSCSVYNYRIMRVESIISKSIVDLGIPGLLGSIIFIIVNQYFPMSFHSPNPVIGGGLVGITLAGLYVFYTHKQLNDVTISDDSSFEQIELQKYEALKLVRENKIIKLVRDFDNISNNAKSELSLLDKCIAGPGDRLRMSNLKREIDVIDNAIYIIEDLAENDRKRLVDIIDKLKDQMKASDRWEEILKRVELAAAEISKQAESNPMEDTGRP